MSTTTVKTDTMAYSKVLPGDKSGLPWEIWQMILSYLSASELCQACRVSRTWGELVSSLDATRWKELYLACPDWRHPHWPLAPSRDPPSWRRAYMEQYIAVHYWSRISSENKHTGCLYVLKRSKERKLIKVGPGLEHGSLKSALAVANSYDRIEIYPGIYDEQFEMSSKIPFELVGHGELGSVILVVSIEQVAMTARLNNLVFRAPWFTSFILKVRSGYLQIDNCILEDGMIYIQHPGTCHISFCTFRHATVILQHVNASVIENCEFSQSDIASIIVEGYSKEEKNWTFPHMCKKMNSVLEQICSPDDQRRYSHATMKTVESQSSTVYSMSSSVVPLLKQSVQGSEPESSSDSELAKNTKVMSIGLQGIPSLDPACCYNCNNSSAAMPDEKQAVECDGRYCKQGGEEKCGEIEIACHPRHSKHSGALRNHLIQHCWDDSGNCGSARVHVTSGSADSYNNGASTNTMSVCQLNLSNCGGNDIGLGISGQNNSSNCSGNDIGVETSRLNNSSNGGNDIGVMVSGHNNSSNDGNDIGVRVSGHNNLSNDGNDIGVETSGLNNSSSHDGNATGLGISLLNDSCSHSVDNVRASGSAQVGVGEDIAVEPGVNAPPAQLANVGAPLFDHPALPVNRGADVPAAALDPPAPRVDVDVNVHAPVFDSDDDDTLSLLDDLGSRRSSSIDSRTTASSSASDSDSESEENVLQTDSDEFSSSEDSVIMLPHLRMQHVAACVSADSVDADVLSVCSQTNTLPVSVSLENLLVTAFSQIQGCLISKCRMMHSKGGLVVSLQAHAMICECDVSNVDYGIRCVQSARVVILKNKIHHCQTSGIFMRLAASGLIGGNDIHSNLEAGIDIRKNADPIVQENRIHHGKRSGIVVLGSGRGQIKKNEIFQNREAGVYVLYGGNPTISENHIYAGRAAGVAINEGGRGLVFGNVIEGNQWGGIDIRHGGNPLICGNSICDGIGDGIVIGEHGQGSIENNNISGNAGCGVWIMSASQPYLQGNQISGNRDSGVLFVNKVDMQHIPHISNSSILSSSHSLLTDLDIVHRRQQRCAVVQYNNVYHNAGRGVVVQLGDEVHVCYNAIHANHSDGVVVDQSAEVLLQGNSITNNNGSGVTTSPGGKVTLLGNGIYHNEKVGIMGKGHVIIHGNDVMGNQAGGISLEGCENAEVLENRVQCSERPALSAVNVAHGVVDNNKLFLDGRLDCIQHDQLSRAIFKHNHIVKPKHSGTEKVEFCKARFLDYPPPRPVIEPPPAPSEIQLHNANTVKWMMAPSQQKSEQGSKFCVIL